MKRITAAIILICFLLCGMTVAYASGGGIFCRMCGAQIPSDSIFCPACGEAVIPAYENGYPQPPTQVNEEAVEFGKNAVPWKDIKQYGVYDADWTYVIALERSGQMHADSLFDIYNVNFVNEINSLRDVRKFIALVNGFGELYVAAITNSGTVKLCCASENLSPAATDLIRGAASLRNVADVVFATDDNSVPNALYALMDDGSVAAVGSNLDKTVLSWHGLRQLCSFYGNFIGLKSDGHCLTSGEAFYGDYIPAYCPASLDLSSWSEVESVYSSMSPWGVNLYALQFDGTMLNHKGEALFRNISTIYYDSNTCHTFALAKDGTCYEYCPTGCPTSVRYNIKSVGVEGIAVTRTGEIVSKDFKDGVDPYTYRVTDEFGSGMTSCPEIRSVDVKTGMHEYLGLGENGRIYFIESSGN